MKKSIFEFGDKFGVESPFGDWMGIGDKIKDQNSNSTKREVKLNEQTDLNRQSEEGKINNFQHDKFVLPSVDQLVYYKYNISEKQWFGFNPWRVNKYPQWKSKLDQISNYGTQLVNKIKANYPLVQTTKNADIMFSYNENDGEYPSFKLNMDYITKIRKLRFSIKIPFYIYEFDRATGNRLEKADWADVIDLHTNCYSDTIGIIGTIDSQEDYLSLLANDGYNFFDYTNKFKTKVNDIIIFYDFFHAMKVTKVNSNGYPIEFISNFRNDYRIQGTFDEINERQFFYDLNIEPPIALARK